jgi:hypothetical protein
VWRDTPSEQQWSYTEKGDEYVVKTKGNGRTESQATSVHVASEEASTENSVSSEVVVPTKSISNAASNQVVSWTIGSKPNANWHLGCFRAHRQARKPSAKHLDRGGIQVSDHAFDG